MRGIDRRLMDKHALGAHASMMASTSSTVTDFHLAFYKDAHLVDEHALGAHASMMASTSSSVSRGRRVHCTSFFSLNVLRREAER